MTALRSVEVFAVAGQLETCSATVRSECEERELSWIKAFDSGLSGDAFFAAFSAENRRFTTDRETAAEIDQVALALTSSASALRQLEFDTDQLLRWAERSSQDSQEVTAVLEELRSIGKAIDLACAHEIKRICSITPPSEEAQKLSDLAFNSSSEINQVQRLRVAEEMQSPEVLSVLKDHPEAELLEVSPSRFVLAYGSIDEANSIVTMVPGVGSADPNSWSRYADRARTIAASTGGAAVLWIGYDAPSSVPAALATAPASIGGGELQEFQAELRRRAARRGDLQHLTVLGHSYGSVVAGHAAQGRGLDADALVLVGSPGTGAKNRAELNVKSEHPLVVATTGHSDSIGLSTTATGGVHGPDPSDPRFGAEVWMSSSNHVGYWDDPNFLRQLAELSKR